MTEDQPHPADLVEFLARLGPDVEDHHPPHHPDHPAASPRQDQP